VGTLTPYKKSSDETGKVWRKNRQTLGEKFWEKRKGRALSLVFPPRKKKGQSRASQRSGGDLGKERGGEKKILPTRVQQRHNDQRLGETTPSENSKQGGDRKKKRGKSKRFELPQEQKKIMF